MLQSQDILLRNFIQFQAAKLAILGIRAHEHASQ